MSSHMHVIPVDPTLTVDEAWKELCIFGTRITDTGTPERWGVVGCDGEECRLIEQSQDYREDVG